MVPTNQFLIYIEIGLEIKILFLRYLLNNSASNIKILKNKMKKHVKWKCLHSHKTALKFYKPFFNKDSDPSNYLLYCKIIVLTKYFSIARRVVDNYHPQIFNFNLDPPENLKDPEPWLLVLNTDIFSIAQSFYKHM